MTYLQYPFNPQGEAFPQMPQVPSYPQMPGFPQAPGFPQMPQFPQAPGFPQVPQVPGFPQAPQLPFVEQSYIENILRLNKGKLATIYMNFENSQWGSKVFKGIIEAAGKDHIIISDPDTGMRYLLLTIYLNYITFDQEINYEYPFAGPTETPLNTQPPVFNVPQPNPQLQPQMIPQMPQQAFPQVPIQPQFTQLRKKN